MKRILLSLFVLNTFLVFSQSLVPQFNKTVSFVYKHFENELRPNGTAFLVSIPALREEGNYVYLVTAKHVVQDENGVFMKKIYFRFNKKEGGSEMFTLVLKEAPKKSFYVHDDESVDLVVFPVVIPSHLDIKHIPISQLIEKEDYENNNIYLGNEVFFTGLFTPYIGNESINPIFRFGRFCLFPDEKIEFVNFKREMLLIESSSFGGNSGSPVLCLYQKDNKKRVALVGVVMGSFNEGQIIENSVKNNVVRSSLGISAITPAKFIKEILYCPELIASRVN
ncbi:hypothetical protein WJN01_05725 [Flavobacteriaceae bacterium SZ-1-7]|uniref:hypothetical protein n=1 Tax=Tamlana sedimenti TaxID=3134126 RepID=UPI003128407B